MLYLRFRYIRFHTSFTITLSDIVLILHQKPDYFNKVKNRMKIHTTWLEESLFSSFCFSEKKKRKLITLLIYTCILRSNYYACSFPLIFQLITLCTWPVSEEYIATFLDLYDIKMYLFLFIQIKIQFCMKSINPGLVR